MCRNRLSIKRRDSIRRGMSLVELLVASAVMGLIALGVASLARTVNEGGEYSFSRGASLQHGRVVLERIEQIVRSAAATEKDPGIAVVYDTVGTAKVADTLVVWRIDANKDKLAQVNELTIFTPDVDKANELIELTASTDVRTVSLTDISTLRTVITGLKSASNRQKVVLTDLLRTVQLPEEASRRRGGVLFAAEIRPTVADVASYRGGTITWANLPWPQGIGGARSGLRQSWVRIELQLVPSSDNDESKTDDQTLPFFGSAALNYEIQR